ncbi:MAG: Holliday junction resolvase RuvX [Alphaproteobacteria bacterium]|nr:Holliday junction resolvase RuvX [Alphaproteobacteria bacterium]
MTHHIRFENKRQELSVSDFKKALGNRGVLLGIDYGSVRIGLALSDAGWEQATPFKIIAKMRELDDIIPAKSVRGIVMGLPLQTDGQEGETARQAHLFADRLAEKFGLPILWVDERYSSLETESYLQEACFMRPNKRKKILDAHVAARLLERAFLQLKK